MELKMITNDDINALTTESRLSGTFAIKTDSNGIKWAVIDKIVLDITTLKLLILWKISNRVNYNQVARAATKTTKMTLIKQLNPQLNGLYSNTKIINEIYNIFTNLTKEQSNRDLINHYKHFISE